MLLPHILYIVTGANRGFGKAIAQTIISKAKVKTICILVGRDQAQLRDIQLENDMVKMEFISNVDLSSAGHAEKTVIGPLTDILEKFKDDAPITKAVLINNAGSTGDLRKTIGEYNSSEIDDYVSLNVSSYISIVAGFIRSIQNYSIMTDMTIVNISSLLAVEAFPNWGLYASGKSARDMLLKVVTKEEDGIRTLSYAPGPLDNSMQQNVRETLADPKQNKLYTKMANEGTLVKMHDSSEKLYTLIEDNNFKSGDHVDYYEL